MKILRKIRKNSKALSPVVASIILIAVTVAVSIAVAAWMGALTVGFMGSSSITVTDVRFAAGTPETIVVDVKNTGTNDVTIAAIKINNDPVATGDFSAGTSLTMASGDEDTITIDQDWTAGNPYKIDLYDSSGQVVGSYQANAA